MSCSFLVMFLVTLLIGRVRLQTPDHYVEVYREGLLTTFKLDFY